MEIRWQIMRGYESAVQVDCENIALRRIIENLQHQKLTTNARHDEVLRQFNAKFKKLVKIARESLADTRQYSEAEMVVMAAKISQVREKVAIIHATKVNTEGDLAGTVEAKKILEALVSQLRSEIVDLNSARKADKERSEALIAKLRVELGEADARHTLDIERYNELRMETDSLHKTNDNLLDEIKRLRMWAQKMEMDGLQTVAEAQEQRQRLVEQHEHIVNSLLAEGRDLRSKIVELQQEVERLQAILAQPVQETHFEKFVNLKKANVQLKSKLTELVKEHQFNEANGTTGAPIKGGRGGGSNSVTGKKSERKEPPMSLQQQVYLAELERERIAATELQAKKDALKLYGEHQDVPPMPGPIKPNAVYVPSIAPRGRSRSRSPVNDSPRSLHSSASNPRTARPVNSAGLQIGVPLMGKQTRDGLAQRVNL